MKIYIAARYEQKPVMVEVRRVLHEAGHLVTSRWLNNKNNIAVVTGDLGRQYAMIDLEDIVAADILLLFTEPGNYSRGGRHFEAGYAFALGRKVYVIGQPENLFHSWCEVVPDLASWLELTRQASDR